MRDERGEKKAANRMKISIFLIHLFNISDSVVHKRLKQIHRLGEREKKIFVYKLAIKVI